MQVCNSNFLCQSYFLVLRNVWCCHHDGQNIQQLLHRIFYFYKALCCRCTSNPYNIISTQCASVTQCSWGLWSPRPHSTLALLGPESDINTLHGFVCREGDVMIIVWLKWPWKLPLLKTQIIYCRFLTTEWDNVAAVFMYKFPGDGFLHDLFHLSTKEQMLGDSFINMQCCLFCIFSLSLLLPHNDKSEVDWLMHVLQRTILFIYTGNAHLCKEGGGGWRLKS